MHNLAPHYDKRETRAIRAAIFLGMLGFISLYIYLPAVPAIAHDFKVPIHKLKISATLFLVGFSISQFYWGSLSAKYGRKRTILFGLAFSSVGTLWVIFAHNLWEFNCARFIEGFGIGCASVLYRALLADSLPTDKLVKILFILVSISNTVPALSPILGSYIEAWFNWRAIFVFLIIYTFMLSMLIQFYTAETSSKIFKDLTFSHAVAEYLQVFKSRIFIGYVIPYLLLSGGAIGYYAVAPFIFVTHLHQAANFYSFLLLFNVAMYVLGAGLSIFTRQFMGPDWAILLGIFCALSASIILLLLNIFSHLSVSTVIVPMMVYVFGCALVAPIANTSALIELKHISGASAAVIGSSLYATSALCSAYIAHLNLSSLSSIAVYTLTLSILALLGFYFLIIRYKAF